MTTRVPEPGPESTPVIVFCQGCGTRNAGNRERCARCGLKLLVFSATPGAAGRFDEERYLEEQENLEENLLERITSLEDGLRNLSTAIAATAEHIEQIEHNLTVTRAGLETVTTLLQSQGIVSEVELQDGWEKTADREFRSRDLARRFRDGCRRILSQAAHSGQDSPEFRRQLQHLERSMVSPDPVTDLDHMMALTRLAPANDELWSLIGENAFEIGEIEMAHTAFTRVLELRGPHLETLIYLGTVASDLQRWDEAKDALTAARDMAPDLFLPHFSLGGMASAHDRPAEAVEHLERALECEEIPQARYLLGLNHLRLGRTGLAIKSLEHAVELQPDYEEALYQLGVAYVRRGWSRRALDTFQRVLRLDPRRLRYQETVRLFSLETPPNLPEAATRLMALAEDALRGGKPERAYSFFSKAVAAAPDHPELRATTALLAASLGLNRQAIGHAHLLLETDRGDSPYLGAAVAALLEALRQAGRIATAKRFALKFIEEGSNSLVRSIAACRYALLAAEGGDDLDDARSMAREALEYTPRELLHIPLVALATVAIRAGRFDEAQRYLEQAAETGPSPEVMRLLAVAHLGTGDRGAAETALAAAEQASFSNLGTDLINQLRSLRALVNELHTG